MLPKVQFVKLPTDTFPTKWQSVVFRNYGYVSVDKIAATLACDEATIRKEAERLGLQNIVYDGNWEKKGYITLIRNNWYLLPYSQLLTLLGITETRLDYILQNDDFLSVKLGGFKPLCEEVRYFPLLEAQKTETEKIADTVRRYRLERAEKPFAFFDEATAVRKKKSARHRRIVHGYLSPCGDVFSVRSETYLPDALLARYAEQGVNGVWLHGVLSELSPYPFDERLSADYVKRREELKKLIARCLRYGIKVYLYFNEPRGLLEQSFGKYGHLIGRRENGYASLCFAKAETKAYLYSATKDLLSDVKELGGIITITMSENLTHCNYRPNTNCPICKAVPPQKTAAEVNNVLQSAIRDSGSGAELIANLWGWSPFMDWTEEQTLQGVELLDKDISVMCVSEYDLKIEKGGVESRIIDYSISNPGPSEISKRTLRKARETGHKVYAKIQTNNSWECSAVPYLPVFDLVYEHLKNLDEIGVRDYMLTWTLGGYPSPLLGLAERYAEAPEVFDLTAWYKAVYGEAAECVHSAVVRFCEGFGEYPFSIDSLYYSPKTLGAANLWELEGQEKRSSMVCFSFDDYENWTKPYPIDVYLSQYEKLLKKWQEGLDELARCAETKAIRELTIYAKTAYSHFLSDYLQTQFSFYKVNDRTRLPDILQREQENAIALLQLYYSDNKVGFEASNHYYYTERNLLEKILQMKKYIKKLKDKEKKR